jgi:hypothetical protein
MSRLLNKHFLTGTTLALAIIAGTSAMAGELPGYQRASLPATPVQLTVLGSAGVEQQSPATTLTRDGMPATQLQLSVLTPRRHRSASAEIVGVARD